jgi:ParB family chromosome partitioning protein
MRNIVTANPFRACMWPLHDRSDQHVTEESCKAEIDSFAKHGQVVPALGRRLQDDPDHDIELIYGARRLFVARHLNKPLLVELREMSDREAIIAMDIENRQRSDVSPYERAMSYVRWMRSGHFACQEDIARALQISPSRVSRLIRLARLPSVILNAFASPLEICETWGRDIMDALEDPHRRQPTIRAARAIGEMNPRPPAKQVYRQLIAAPNCRQPSKSARMEIVRDGQGAPLFRIRWLNSSVSLVVPNKKLTANAMTEIQEALAGILSEQRPRKVKVSERASSSELSDCA